MNETLPSAVAEVRGVVGDVEQCWGQWVPCCVVQFHTVVLPVLENTAKTTRKR